MQRGMQREEEEKVRLGEGRTPRTEKEKMGGSQQRKQED